MVRNLPAMQETWVGSLGWEDPLEEEMATYSSILAWRVPWIEEPGELQSAGSQRVGHDWGTNTTEAQSLPKRVLGSADWSPLLALLSRGLFFFFFFFGCTTEQTWSSVCTATQSCVTLCDPMDCSPPRSTVHGIFQARILEWVVVQLLSYDQLFETQRTTVFQASLFFTLF